MSGEPCLNSLAGFGPKFIFKKISSSERRDKYATPMARPPPRTNRTSMAAVGPRIVIIDDNFGENNESITANDRTCTR